MKPIDNPFIRNPFSDNRFSFELGMKESEGIEGRKDLILGNQQRICVLDSLKFLHS
jgi:hypothetical protein